MKSSPYRKRYILVRIENLSSRLKSVESTFYRVFRAKSKYVEGEYAIFRTNQFDKEKFIDFIMNEMEGVEPIITSGTIKKCKTAIPSVSDKETVKAEV